MILPPRVLQQQGQQETNEDRRNEGSISYQASSTSNTTKEPGDHECLYIRRQRASNLPQTKEGICCCHHRLTPIDLRKWADEDWADDVAEEIDADGHGAKSGIGVVEIVI